MNAPCIFRMRHVSQIARMIVESIFVDMINGQIRCPIVRSGNNAVKSSMVRLASASIDSEISIAIFPSNNARASKAEYVPALVDKIAWISGGLFHRRLSSIIMPQHSANVSSYMICLPRVTIQRPGLPMHGQTRYFTPSLSSSSWCTSAACGMSGSLVPFASLY